MLQIGPNRFTWLQMIPNEYKLIQMFLNLNFLSGHFEFVTVYLGLVEIYLSIIFLTTILTSQNNQFEERLGLVTSRNLLPREESSALRLRASSGSGTAPSTAPTAGSRTPTPTSAAPTAPSFQMPTNAVNHICSCAGLLDDVAQTSLSCFL